MALQCPSDASNRANETVSESVVKGLSSSSHVCGIDDSISPTEGSNIPVFGSRIAALAGCWVVVNCRDDDGQ